MNFKQIIKEISSQPDSISKGIIFVYRFGNWIYYQYKNPIFKKILWIIYKVLNAIIVRGIAGCTIPAQCKIGNGLILKHGAQGTMLNGYCVIGNNATIYHQVTIGVKGPHDYKAPVIGESVFIGAGAKILGDIKIGDNCLIGANSVVITDIRENSTAVGVPARAIAR
jgi:serine O-acetyltransferase